MYIAIQHSINDPERFWQTAEKEIPNLPGNLKVVSAYPSPDGKSCNCLWEADSLANVQSFMDQKFGPFAKNYCYEVAPSKAIGLPA